ncbi:hypothetical protein [Paraglaciecola hydrolytica]|uniref:Phage abortive infection protein n=1 Tax=Paraglaciecola hydrolytica TaxID=1799789 RepID=A0A148KKZ7_9ALTE|nr:hypothetical protein [Paraglaciecola hydrolytica]KXI26967.1 hypothetical protein AX660_02395 [Paraglaciecola hydrolytica]
MESKKTNSRYYFYLLLGGLLLFAFLCLLVTASIYFYFFSGPIGNQETFAQFGDFMGGVLNPIFSFLTIFLLVGSLALQRQELSKVIEELELTRHVHQSTVNMSHYEYILEEFERGNSGMHEAASGFADKLDELITLDNSSKEIGNTNEYSMLNILSNDPLMTIASQKGYFPPQGLLGVKINARDFNEKLEVLDASVKVMLGEIKQLKSLGCPELRAKAFIQVGRDLILERYDSSIINNTARKNISTNIKHFDEFREAFKNYP